jgi:hypothetical protein
MTKTEKAMLEKEKQIARINWECLMRNDNFIEFWNFWRERKNDPSTAIPEKFKPTNNPDGIKCAPPIMFVWLKYWYYLPYQTPYTAKFEEYWSMFMKFRNSAEHKKSLSDLKAKQPLIEDYIKKFSEDYDFAVDTFKNKKKRDPTIDELKHVLLWKMKWGRLILQINTFGTMSDIDKRVKEVRAILKSRIPRKRFPKDELYRYLRVYDLRKTKPPTKYKDICKELFPNNKFNEEIRQKLTCYRRKAMKMIENAEQGKHLW